MLNPISVALITALVALVTSPELGVVALIILLLVGASR